MIPVKIGDRKKKKKKIGDRMVREITLTNLAVPFLCCFFLPVVPRLIRESPNGAGRLPVRPWTVSEM